MPPLGMPSAPSTSSPSSLPWYDWLVLPATALRRCGVDPDKRQEVTGHSRPLSRMWARTIGYWCRAEPRDFMRTLGLDPGEFRDRNTFESYKSRNGLYTVQNCADIRKIPVDLWRQISGVTLADDVVTYYAHFEEKYPGDRRNIARLVAEQLGILPVEAVLYREALNDMLRRSAMTYAEFLEMEGVRRAELWDLTEAGIQSPDAVRFRGA